MWTIHQTKTNRFVISNPAGYSMWSRKTFRGAMQFLKKESVRGWDIRVHLLEG